VKQEVSDADPFIDTGYGAELWDIVLSKCKTAREAVDMIEQMGNSKGFSDWAAGSMAVADPNEAWDIELLGGHHWVAERIPDNAYLVQPNVLRLKQIDLSKRNKFRGSPDLVQFAISLGIYDPSQGPFDLAWVYNDPDDLTEYYNTNRMWRVTTRFNPTMALDPTMLYSTRSLFLVPERKLSRFDFMSINRDHYELSNLDQTLDYTLMDPHNQTDRPICYHDTDYAAVWQLRGWMPDPIGGVLWLAPSHPCSSTFVPFYAGITEVSAAWSAPAPLTAFKTFHAVSKNLDKDGSIEGENRYNHFIPLVQSTYGAFEEDEAEDQAGVELSAWWLWQWSPSAASDYLTQYSQWRANQALRIAKSLEAQTKGR
jgi:dipeptidase